MSDKIWGHFCPGFCLSDFIQAALSSDWWIFLGQELQTPLRAKTILLCMFFRGKKH